MAVEPNVFGNGCITDVWAVAFDTMVVLPGSGVYVGGTDAFNVGTGHVAEICYTHDVM